MQSDRILYRGFLLQKVNGIAEIKDIRNPYYRAPKVEDLKVLLEMGFFKGATYLLMKSDLKKIERYKRLIENKKKLLDQTENPRKIQEHLNSIERYSTEIKYYKSQVRRWQKSLKTS